MNIRMVCGVLLGLAAWVQASAAGAPTAKRPIFYASRLHLDHLDQGLKEGEQLQFFCNSTHERGDPMVVAIAACSDERLESTRGTTIEVDYVYVESAVKGCPKTSEDDVTLKGTEVARKSVFAKEVSEIASALGSRTATPAPGAKELAAADKPLAHVCTVPLEYVLTLDRAVANLTVTVKGTPDVSESQPLLTGRPEHWFITGDAIVRGVKELKYDSTSKSIVERDKPTQFYVGFNCMAGDLLAKAPQLSTDRIVGKILVSPSKNPFDSIGVGIGYRLIDGVYQSKPSDPNVGDISGGLVIFGGHFWTKNDKVDSATGAVTQGGRSRSWRIGLSYDVSSLLGWLQ